VSADGTRIQLEAGDLNMLRKTKIVLAAACILAPACVALAANENDDSGGYRELGPGGFVTDGVNPAYHPSLRAPADNAYGYGPGSATCAQRFKSYDPTTQTYIGKNGVRHSCRL
jgi:hypothetical protein